MFGNILATTKEQGCQNMGRHGHRHDETQRRYSGEVRIGELRMRSHGRLIRVSEHPYARALASHDAAAFRRYTEGGKHRHANDSWSAYQRLVAAIRRDGYDGDRKPHAHVRACRSGKHGAEYLRVTHGRHRLPVLWHLYGDDAVVVVSKSRVVGVKSL